MFEAHSAALLLPASLILPGLKHSSRAPAHPAVQQGCSVRREQCRLCFRRLCSHTVAEHHAQRTRRVQRITPASSPATGAAGCEAAGSTSRAGREARGISAGGEPRCWGSGRLPCAQGPAQPPARPRSTRVPAAPPAPPERGSWGAGRGRSAARIGRKVVAKFFVRALIGRGLQGCDPAAYARRAGCLGAAERAGIGIRIGAVRGCGAGRDGAGGRTDRDRAKWERGGRWCCSTGVGAGTGSWIWDATEPRGMQQVELQGRAHAHVPPGGWQRGSSWQLCSLCSPLAAACIRTAPHTTRLRFSPRL